MIFRDYFKIPGTQIKTLTHLKNIYAKKVKDDHQKIERFQRDLIISASLKHITARERP